MENIQDNNKEYIELSKNNIDRCLYFCNYKQAFGLLILVLERLDDNDKKEFINYYSRHLYMNLLEEYLI